MNPVKILLVDDDDSIRSILRIVLSFENAIGEVREAADGASAIRICGDFAPDVVLLDYWMPQMDGSRTAVFIREMHPGALIVAYSSALHRKPDWADEFIVKDDIPDPTQLVDIARGQPEV